MKSEPRAWYEQRRAHLHEQQKHNAFKFDVVAYGRLVLLLAAVTGAVLTVVRGWGQTGWAVVSVLLVLFVVFVSIHRRLVEVRTRLQLAAAYFEKGLARLDDKWEQFPRHGGELAEKGHGYALDLDLFGPGSLFQLLNDTSTARGERILASWLQQPSTMQQIQQRQEAVREVSGDKQLREAVAVAGRMASGAEKDVEPLVTWASGQPRLQAVIPFQALAWVVCLSFVGLAAAPLPWWAALVPYLVGVVLLGALGNKLEPTISAVTDRVDALQRSADMLTVVQRHTFEAPVLTQIQADLKETGAEASVEINRLARLVAFLDARRNGAFRALIGPALMWDLHWVLALERWQRRAGASVDVWLRRVAELEAICSLATFAYENPDYGFAQLQDGPIHFEAAGLGHPLLSRSGRVLNDVSMPGPGHVLLVTGSNMSGKSTLLRSIGLAAVLGLSGAPSCCRELRMSLCAVRSSMRVEDSVRGGVSRFYAELQQVKRVCDTAKQRPVLFLLDEIFHGTNSRERHIGARSVVRRLIAREAVGAVSTHDVALAALTEEVPNKIHLVHFQEDIRDGQMVFDYKLRSGVVKSGNALRWMRHVGLDVDLEESSDGQEGGEPPISAGGTRRS